MLDMKMNFNEMSEMNVALLVFSIMVTVFLMICSLTSKTRSHKFMKGFSYVLIGHILMQLGETGIWIFQGKPNRIVILEICCILSFGVGTFMTSMFTYCILYFFMEKQRVSLLPAYIMTVFSILNFVLVVLSVKSGRIFLIDRNGNFLDGQYEFIIYIFDILTYLTGIGVIIYYRKCLSRREFLALTGYGLAFFTTMFMVNIWYPVPLYLSTTLFLLLTFIVFFEDLSRQLAEKEKKLSERKIQIMISQIQPHFMYNSLNTIYHLCDKDAGMAKMAVSSFSEYLKHILKSVNRNTPVPFNEELKYVKSYLELEKLRFDDDLNIIYNIEATDFFVPALSIQPLVENAVKHGLCRKEEGGTLALSTRERKDCFEIEILDDGVGFDPKNMPQDGKIHVGIQNAKQRLYAMCQSSVEIKSKPGEGTTVIVHIPKPDAE